MTSLTRYVVWELLKVFLVALAALTVVMVLVGVLQEAIRMNLGFGPTLRLIPFVLPNALSFAVPGTILLTVCQVFGRMAADNEVVALKSLGISPLVLLWPAFTLAFLLSLVSVWLNDLAFSWGYVGMQRVVLQSVEEIAYGMLRTQRAYTSARFSIIVKAVEDRRLIRPTMTFQAHQNVPAFTLTADEAELRSNLSQSTLTLILTNCEIETTSGVQGVFPGTIEREVPLSYFSAKGDVQIGPSHLPLRRIPGEIQQQQKIIRQLEQTQAAEAGFALMTGEFDKLSVDYWRGHRKSLENAVERLHRLRVEPWRRWANGFSCLCFVLVGAPLAIRLRNADFMTTFGLCFLPILFLYYPFLIFGLDRAKAGALPPYSVWGANLLCVALGLMLIRRVLRY